MKPPITIRLILVISIVLLTTGLFTPVEAGERKKITFATLAPKSSSWGNLIRRIARNVYKKSDKSLVLKVFYGGVQGDEKEMEEKIRFKQLGGAFLTGNGLGEAVYESRILDIPGLIRNYQELDYVYPRLLEKLNIYYHRKGYVLIGLVDVGYAYFFSQKDIHSISDIRKSKMWTWKGDQLSLSMMKRLNLPAVPVSFTEVIPSLQTGLIDGVYATTTSLISLQWHREIKYMLDLPLTLVSSGVVLSKQIWDSLSQSDQKLILETTRQEFKNYQPIIRKSDRDSIELLKQQGVIINPSKETVKDIAALSQSLIDEFPKPLRQELTRLLKEIRR